MPTVFFTENLQRHVVCPPGRVTGGTVRDVFDAVFVDNERARGYVLDDRGGVRRHMAVFVDGEPIVDRVALSDRVGVDSEIFIMQALSGG